MPRKRKSRGSSGSDSAQTDRHKQRKQRGPSGDETVSGILSEVNSVLYDDCIDNSAGDDADYGNYDKKNNSSVNLNLSSVFEGTSREASNNMADKEPTNRDLLECMNK